jgi:hypothetical protein
MMSITPSALQSQVQRILWSLRYRGLGVTALSCLANLCSWTGKQWYWQYKEHQFDRRHRVDTSGLIPIESLDVRAEDRDRGWGYMATQPEWFHIVLSQLAIDYERYVFVDFGSGKGRALLLASTLPFKEVIGVEFCDALHRIAQTNIDAWQQSAPPRCKLRSISADATTFAIPPEPAVLYFYNPFKESVMREVVANIESSHRHNPRHLILVYANPTCETVLEEAAWLNKLAEIEGEPQVVVYEAVSDQQSAFNMDH